MQLAHETTSRGILTPRQLRMRARWSKARMAVAADVGVGLVTLYELGGPLAVHTHAKRASLARTYRWLETCVQHAR